MKYCPYCGAVLVDGAASFCNDCGRALPVRQECKKSSSHQTHSESENESPQPRKKRKSRRKNPRTENRRNMSADLPVDDGYDGYYDDVPTEDDGHLREGLDRELVKRIIWVGAGAASVIILAILAMRFL